MESKSSLQADIARKVAECLKEFGLEAEVRLSEHEAVVHATKDVQGACLRVVTHVSDRTARTAASGFPHPEATRARLAMVSIRPTLATQAAARQSPAPTKDPCG